MKKADCDNLFYDLMLAHCNDRVASGACIGWAATYSYFVQQVSVSPNPPRNYAVIAQHSGKCLDVEGGSFDHGARLIQWACHYGNNQQFQINYPGFVDPVDYNLRSKQSGKCVAVWDYGLSTEIRQGVCEPQSTHFLWWVKGYGSVNQYTFRPRSSANWSECLDVPYSSIANGVGLIRYPCFETSNQRWAIVHLS